MIRPKSSKMWFSLVNLLWIRFRSSNSQFHKQIKLPLAATTLRTNFHPRLKTWMQTPSTTVWVWVNRTNTALSWDRSSSSNNWQSKHSNRSSRENSCRTWICWVFCRASRIIVKVLLSISTRASWRHILNRIITPSKTMISYYRISCSKTRCSKHNLKVKA